MGSPLDDDLRHLASASLHSLFLSGKASIPISSSDLLSCVITSGVAASLPSPVRTFKLTDLSRFEKILEELARDWEHGTISLSDDGGALCVVDVNLSTGDTDSPVVVGRKRKRTVDEDADSAAGDTPEESDPQIVAKRTGSTLQNLSKEMKEVYMILQKSTAKGRLLAERFQSVNGTFEPICPHITKNDCAKARLATSPDTSTSPLPTICDRVHFRALIRPHTDVSLGHCSYLNTCYSEPTYAQSPSIPPLPSAQHASRPPGYMAVSLPSGLGAGGRGKEKAPCRYLHYEIDWDEGDGSADAKTEGKVMKKPHKLGIGLGPLGKETEMLPPQWINCDLRRFDYSVLGKFHVIYADPPWDIHMSLPYGTMTDDEMRSMPIPTLQDEGLLFLWVTGRAMEVGRECMRVWGYTRVDEVVWVKINQLQRVIRTGRTGHWLNHTKEHMLVGVKTVTDENGNLKFPSWVNRGLDTDVIVSEVRETSRKPDEVYGIIERMCPGGRKIEIFGRKHNTRPGWLTLGNQLGADQIHEEDLAARIKAR
ncbi:MT-A70-domain-containing protein [Neolentinus lepideus HHB14362 ss-1]|uniref:mRNA m(6)A methyltransferase n=1 Tax=Neolentinus lepideus HHB14362 ss-1 TaxID=1314782 RepID=A0A165TPT9_9AGAM|nr:MT-A70-domain-containing protein [Neolentinus lepideus HHB14362 ss-1]